MLLPTLCGLARLGDVGLVSLRFVPGRGSTYTGGRPFAHATVPSKFDPKGCVLPSFRRAIGIVTTRRIRMSIVHYSVIPEYRFFLDPVNSYVEA